MLIIYYHELIVLALVFLNINNAYSNQSTNLNQNSTLGTNVSKTVVGTSINLTATTVNTLFGTNTELNTTIQIVGRDSGARITVPIKITKTNN